MRCASGIELPGALDAHQHARGARGADRAWPGSPQAPRREVFASKESFTPRCFTRRDGRQRTHRPIREVDAREGLLDLERSRLAGLGVHTIPVVQTKCDIAVLLDLEDDERRPRGNGRCPPAEKLRRPLLERTMRADPPPFRWRAPVAVRLPWCRASTLRRCGSRSPLRARPRLRSSPSRPPSGDRGANPADGPGPRGSRARRENFRRRGKCTNRSPRAPMRGSRNRSIT